MDKLNTIEAKVLNKAGKETEVSDKNMRIPGMKIGTQMSPGAPSYEDIMWLVSTVKKCRQFIKSTSYEHEEDMLHGKKIVEDIDKGV